jgi:GT2 family glycosyltransferase
MPAATVIIATHNRAQELRTCLTGLARQSARNNFEVLVVDNGSQDDTAAIIAAAGVRSVFVEIPNRAKARNAGIAAAGGDVVVFCDDDTLAPQDWVAAHLAAHADRPNAVVSGPIVNVADAAHLVAPGRRHYSRAFFCTCNVSVARCALLAAGGFDERYDLYGWEDTDLGIRLRANGARRIFEWSAFIYHMKPPAAMTLARRQSLAREKGAMAARFVRKSPTWPVKLATGAYALNFGRAALLRAAPVRVLCERLAGGHEAPRSPLETLAVDTLVDGAYVDALRAALRYGRADG